MMRASVTYCVSRLGYGLDDRGIVVRFPACVTDFSILCGNEADTGPTQHPCQCVQGGLPLLLKRSGCKVFTSPCLLSRIVSQSSKMQLSLHVMRMHVKFFGQEIILFENQSMKKKFHFSFCESLKLENETPFPLYFVLGIIHDLQLQWQNHFENRDVYSMDFIREEMPPELQMELIDFHCNVGLQDKFIERHVINFFERWPEDRCAQIRSFDCVYVSVFCTS